MTLQQLRYLSAIAQNGLNITAAARRLQTSQPAISKQIKLLERELGVNIFVRRGRSLSGVTSTGRHVVERALRMLREAHSIRGMAQDLKPEDQDTLAIGTTHTQARYVLPALIRTFLLGHPNIELHLHQGTLEQIGDMVQLDRLDLAIAAGPKDLSPKLVMLPWYRWHLKIIVTRDHALAGVRQPSPQQLAAFPIVTYVFGSHGSSSLHQLFRSAGARANVALTAHDADVIKTYVRLNLGIGIIASMAYCPDEDADLIPIDASHLFPAHTTWIGFPRREFLRRHVSDFVQLLAPHLDRAIVGRAAALESAAELDALYQDLSLPLR